MKTIRNHVAPFNAIMITTMILAACAPGAIPSSLSKIPASATPAAEDSSPALFRPGPYTVATREMKFLDTTRGGQEGGQEIEVTIWLPVKGDAPDMSGAPYPVILYSHGGDISDGMAHRLDNSAMLRHLASYGFVAVAPEHKTEAYRLFTDHPMDILALIAELDRLAVGEFDGVLDMSKIGMMGLSAGTATTLQMGGARMDYAYFDPWCVKNSGSPYCLADVVKRGREDVSETLLKDSNGLYYVNSDARIRALALMSPCFEPAFGERGLKTVSLPILLLAPRHDEFCNYQDETIPMYQNLASKDRYLITMVNGSHNYPLIPTNSHNAVMTAFFSVYLKGQEEYARYLAEDYVNALQGLSWGVYQH